MNAAPQSNWFSFVSLALKLAGLVLILGVLVDFIVITIPPNFTDSTWLANLINEWVGRANIPLIGLALIIFGVWVGQREGREGKSGKNWLVWSLVLSGLLGIIFVLMAPVYFRSSQLASAAETRQINQQAAAAENQLNTQLEQQRSQVSAVLANQELMAQLQQRMQNASQLSDQEQTFLQQVQTILQEVKNDPKALDKKVEEARQQGMQQIKTEQQKAIDNLTSEMRESRIRIPLSSVLLAAGYFIVAGGGLGAAGRGSSKAKAKTKASKAKRKRSG